MVLQGGAGMVLAMILATDAYFAPIPEGVFRPPVAKASGTSDAWPLTPFPLDAGREVRSRTRRRCANR